MGGEKPEKPELETPKAEKESEKVSQELEALRDKLLRNAADYDNARKRLQKEREEFIKFSQERLLRELLPILDNFERALPHLGESASEAQDPAKALVTGIQMISKQLLRVLASYGMKRFSSLGEPFDPYRHEAVEQVEEEGPEGIVIQEVLPGYLLHDRVIRPAKVRVRVSKKKEEKEEELT